MTESEAPVSLGEQRVRVTVMTRAGCHLCQEAETIVAEVCAELGVGWASVDVDADARQQDQYGDRVPVILVDGREHAYLRVERDRLRAALTASGKRWGWRRD